MSRIDKASRAKPLTYTLAYFLALALGLVLSGLLRGNGPASFTVCVQLYWIYLVHSGSRELLDIGSPPTSGISYAYIIAGCLLVAGFLTSIVTPDEPQWSALASAFMGFGLITSFLALRAAAADVVAAEARFTQERHAEITTATMLLFMPIGVWFLRPRLQRLAASQDIGVKP